MEERDVEKMREYMLDCMRGVWNEKEERNHLDSVWAEV